MAEKIVMTNSNEATGAIFGAFDKNVRLVEEAFGVHIFNRNLEEEFGDAIVINGEESRALLAARTLEYLKKIIGTGESVEEGTVEYVIGLVKDGEDKALDGVGQDVICLTNRGKPIKAKTVGQKSI